MGVTIGKIAEVLFSCFGAFSNNEIQKTNSTTILHLDNDKDIVLKRCVHGHSPDESNITHINN